MFRKTRRCFIHFIVMFKESATSPYPSITHLKCAFHYHVERYLALLPIFQSMFERNHHWSPSFVTIFRKIRHWSLSITFFIQIRHWSLYFITHSEETVTGPYPSITCLEETTTGSYASPPCLENPATGP